MSVNSRVQNKVRNLSSPEYVYNPHSQMHSSRSNTKSYGEGRQHFQGALDKFHGRFLTSWRRYWFVLHGDQLTYFKDEKISSGLHHGLIDLTMAVTINACASPSRGYPFELVTNTRKYILSASSEQVRDQWIDCIQHAIVRRRHSEFGASMSRPSCQSIEEDETMTQRLDSMLSAYRTAEAQGKLDSSGLVSGPGNDSSNTIRSKEPSVNNITDPNSILRKKLVRLQSSADNMPKTVRQVESDVVPHAVLNDEASPSYSVIWPGQTTNTSSAHQTDNQDENHNNTGKYAIRRQKTQLSRLRPTVSNAEASRFYYDSLHPRQDESEDDVFMTGKSTDITREPPAVTDSLAMDVKSQRALNSKFQDIPNLPYPRIEMTFTTTPFDKIRLFIAQHRGPDEFYPTPDSGELGGKAMSKLYEFVRLLP